MNKYIINMNEQTIYTLTGHFIYILYLVTPVLLLINANI